MSLRTSTPLTEQLLAFLSGVEDAFDFPRSMRQLVYRHEYEHWKLATRRTAALRRDRKRIKQALWNLAHAEYLTAIEQRDGIPVYRLTPKGWMKFALKYAKKLHDEATAVSSLSIKRGSYVVIFDIPERHRHMRDLFRQILLNIGCTPLQKSIFLTHDSRTIRFVARVVANCELEDRVKILLVKSII